MDIFKIERYNGEEQQVSPSLDVQLLKLQAKIEERRKRLSLSAKKEKKKENRRKTIGSIEKIDSTETVHSTETVDSTETEIDSTETVDSKETIDSNHTKKKEKRRKTIDSTETMDAAGTEKKEKKRRKTIDSSNFKLEENTHKKKKKKRAKEKDEEDECNGENNDTTLTIDSEVSFKSSKNFVQPNNKENTQETVDEIHEENIDTQNKKNENAKILEDKNNEENFKIDEENSETVLSKEDNEEISNELENPTAETNDRLFPILGRQKHTKLVAVKRNLPRWLAEPVSINANIETGKVPVGEFAFAESTLANLRSAKIDHLFPVQATLLPYLHAQSIERFPPRDICVESPTGSGKTLSYALPIVEHVSRNVVREIYCLVVLPSKDLAVQVKQVFDAFTSGTRVKVGLACGMKTLEKERTKLVSKSGGDSFLRNVDILVATPGRLVDHLTTTTGFTLKHLRYLVIDEADRLLGQEYSDWLNKTLNSVYSNGRGPIRRITANTIQACTPLQKMLFSATLTQNPEKLAPLNLHHPLLFTSKRENQQPKEEGEEGEGRFIIPAQLTEQMVVVEEGVKPLVVVHLMGVYKTKVLCFTKSIEATHRLNLLLSSFSGFTCAEFSSSLTETQRRAIIRDFKQGGVDILISSDAMARGMDISDVNLVINYDPASSTKTYVHRVGRTARAGNPGTAITILSSKEVFHFKKMSKKLSGRKPTNLKIDDLNKYEDEYEKALSKLQHLVLLEKKNKR